MAELEMDPKLEYVKLLDLLARVINANKGFSVSDISNGERLWDAHALANKFIGHAFTVLHLSHGTEVQDLPSFKFSFVDSASIDVLARVTLEAFLVSHYVFFASITTEEKNYRYLAYRAAGIVERQNVPVSTEEHRQKLAAEKEELDKLQDKLKSNTAFQNLNQKQKKLILKGHWRLSSWREIAIDAGLSEVLARHVYGSLSGYAHSSSLSVLQTAQALRNREGEQLVRGSLNIMNIVIANMVQEYCGLFSRAQAVLKEDPEASNRVKVWVEIGRRLDENLDIGQGND